jgi:Spy/CpxP family protein refolding chaperone
LAHFLVGEPATTPHQVRARLSPEHAQEHAYVGFTKLYLSEKAGQRVPPSLPGVALRPRPLKENPMSDMSSSDRPVRRSRGRAAVIMLVVALAGGLVGAFATQSLGQGFGPPWHMTVMGPGGLHGPFGGPPLTADQIAERADHLVRHLAIELDASADQTTKLEAIVKGAVTDLVPMRDKIMAARQQARTLLTGPTVDRAAIEKLRAEQVANVDAVSKRITQAFADMADVLTPDQRRKIDEMLPRPGEGGGYWRGWHRG